MKHTPGPWEIVEDNGWLTIRPHNDKTGLVAGNIGGTYAIGLQGHEENKANARLLASAPELLEALQTIADIKRSDGLYDHYDAKGAIKIAEQAIAEATKEGR